MTNFNFVETGFGVEMACKYINKKLMMGVAFFAIETTLKVNGEFHDFGYLIPTEDFKRFIIDNPNALHGVDNPQLKRLYEGSELVNSLREYAIAKFDFGIRPSVNGTKTQQVNYKNGIVENCRYCEIVFNRALRNLNGVKAVYDIHGIMKDSKADLRVILHNGNKFFVEVKSEYRAFLTDNKADIINFNPANKA